jgi:lysophospholipase L1-like esterase
MRRCIAIFVLLAGAIGLRAQSPWSTTTFTPAPTLTGTGQTSAPVILQRSTATRDSYSAGKIIVTGVGLTTATFSILGSTNSGASYNVLATEPCSSPGTFATSQTVTASPSCYEVNLSSLYSVEFTTSGTFTGTSITLLLTANPNAQITRNGNGGGGGTGVQSINGVAGAFTFDGSGVSCSATTCDFTGGPASPGGTTGAMQFNNAGALGGLNGTGIPVLNGAAAPTIASAAQLTTQVNGVNCELGGTCNTPLICGGGASNCVLQQINPAPCATTTSLASDITATQTTIPLVSTACVVAPLIIANSNNGNLDFSACTGISGNTLTGCTRGLYTATPGTGEPLAASGSFSSQVTNDYAASSTVSPYFYTLQNGAVGYGGSLNSITPNGVNFAGPTQFQSGITAFGTVGLAGDINTGAVNSAQAHFSNPSAGTGACSTTGPVFNSSSSDRSWFLFQTSGSCTLGANNLPPNAFGALINATPGTFPAAGTGFSWYVDTASLFHSAGGFAVGANTVIPATTTGFQGNSAGVDIPMSLPWTTPSAITSICHDANGNVTDASCPTSSGTASLTRISHGSSFLQYGDSITAGFGLTTPLSTRYGAVMSSDLNMQYINRAVSGDQACDLWPIQLNPNLAADSPVQATASIATMLIGTNDVDVKGVGAYEVTFNTCFSAFASFMAIPAEQKILPGNAAYTNVSGTNSASPVTVANVTQAVMTATGVQQAVISTTGNPIYVWQFLSDGVSGAFTVAVDGGAATTCTTAPVTAMATQNGVTSSVGLCAAIAASGTPAAPVAHTVTFTWVSGTAGIVGIGSLNKSTYYTQPIVIAGQVPNQSTTTNLAAELQYTSDITSNVSTLVTNGMDVRVALDRNYMLGTAADFAGGSPPLHPGPTGQAEIARSYEAVLQPSYNPPSSVYVIPFFVETSGSTTGTVGTTATPITGSTSAGFSVAMSTPLPVGTLNEICQSFVTADGTTPITYLILNSTVAGTYSLASSFTVIPSAAQVGTSSANSVQCFFAGRDFDPLAITANQFLGYAVTSNNTEGGFAPGGTFFIFTGIPTTTPTAWTSEAFAPQISATVTSGTVPTSYTVSLPGFVPPGHCGVWQDFVDTTITAVSAGVGPRKAGSIVVNVPAATNGLAYDGTCTPY